MGDMRLNLKAIWRVSAGLVLLAACALSVGCARQPEILAALAHPTPFATVPPMAPSGVSPTPPQASLPSPSRVPTQAPMPTVEESPTPLGPAPTETQPPNPAGSPQPTPEAASPSNPYLIGGIDLADSQSRLLLSYPRDLASGDLVTVPNIEILVSDQEGQNLAYFMDIGSWLGTHKVFVYPDTASGRPIVSVHDGYYAEVPLEGEALRYLIEGSVYSPYSLDVIHENLASLVGRRIYLEQDGTRAEFQITQGIRMDAATTEEFTYRPGDLSTLLGPLGDADSTFFILMCSTRQPDEPDRVFPARFVLAAELVAGS